MQTSFSGSASLKEIPRAQLRPPAIPLAHYQSTFSDIPDIGMAAAYLSGDYSMKAIAEAFGVHYSKVSRAIKAYEVSNIKIIDNVVLQDLALSLLPYPGYCHD